MELREYVDGKYLIIEQISWILQFSEELIQASISDAVCIEIKHVDKYVTGCRVTRLVVHILPTN